MGLQDDGTTIKGVRWYPLSMGLPVLDETKVWVLLAFSDGSVHPAEWMRDCQENKEEIEEITDKADLPKIFDESDPRSTRLGDEPGNEVAVTMSKKGQPHPTHWAYLPAHPISKPQPAEAN